MHCCSKENSLKIHVSAAMNFAHQKNKVFIKMHTADKRDFVLLR